MKIHLRTFGCTYNMADSDALKEKLSLAGHEFVQEKEADIVIFNTCSVKDATEQKALHLIKKEKKPLVVTGCLAASPEKIGKANASASVVGTFSQDKIADAVEAAAKGERAKFLGKTGRLENALSVSGLIGRIRISTGCLGACAYCQTKLARGNLESFPIKNLRFLAEQTVAHGAKEIQLTSQDCACYGLDIGESLPPLVNAISSIEGDFRVRVGMGNPDHFKRFFPSFLDAVSSEKVYNFAHIPVQSGSDHVLRQMSRAYTSDDFTSLVSDFRKKFPDGMVATDVIVGYPTETGAD
ncbi:MiaB/RimO family radical SAM methylthiotransferase, partial [Candidatus Micrarchaeota archaeon]|nr:MiaB/RimO family radical SAM methylthiotransferase [Candidatus Micrarchaeota archaeon]